jgi:hypothetical protein
VVARVAVGDSRITKVDKLMPLLRSLPYLR